MIIKSRKASKFKQWSKYYSSTTAMVSGKPEKSVNRDSSADKWLFYTSFAPFKEFVECKARENVSGRAQMFDRFNKCAENILYAIYVPLSFHMTFPTQYHSECGIWLARKHQRCLPRKKLWLLNRPLPMIPFEHPVVQKINNGYALFKLLKEEVKHMNKIARRGLTINLLWEFNIRV